MRILAGAVTLFALVQIRRGAQPRIGGGTWIGAAALFGYALLFSLAYVRVEAGVGALVLFGAVQITMFVAALLAGERPAPRVWLGLAIAFGGLVALALPGAAAPDPMGAALMLGAGFAWGVYSLRGKRAADPIAATTDHFVRCVPLVGVALLAHLTLAADGTDGLRISTRGVTLAIASGAVASGLGYAVWYTALRGLTAARAAVVQLAVPVLAAFAGTLLLDEPVSSRLLGAGAAILGGIGLALSGRRT